MTKCPFGSGSSFGILPPITHPTTTAEATIAAGSCHHSGRLGTVGALA